MTLSTVPSPVIVTLGAIEPVTFSITDLDGLDISNATVKIAFTLDPLRPPVDPSAAAWKLPVVVSAVGDLLVVRLQVDLSILPVRGRYDVWFRVVDGPSVLIRRKPQFVWAE